MAIIRMLKSPRKLGDAFVEDNGEVMTVKDGRISDSHFISPEADPERFRIVGALGEMLFEQIRQSFRADSVLVIAQNEDFRIVMLPRDGGIAVWKTNLEEHEILQVLRRRKDDQEKPVHEG